MLLWGKLLYCIYMKAEAFIYFSGLSQAKAAPYARMRDFAKSRFCCTTLYFTRCLPFQLLGISLAAGTLSRGVVLSAMPSLALSEALAAPCHFVSTKPFWCWSAVSRFAWFRDSSACARTPFAFAFRCCASP